MEKEEQSREYIYVYGITNKDIKLNFKGLKDKPIKKINFKDILVLTSSYPSLHPVLNDEEAVLHAEILNKIVKKTTIIPMSLSTVFENQKILEGVLLKSYRVIKESLRLMDGKIELGVKVVKNQGPIEDGIAQKVLEALNKLSVESVKGDNFSDRLLLNNSFLVEKNKFSRFSNKIAELEGKYPDLKFLYTGPWPPYSFVNIKIKGG